MPALNKPPVCTLCSESGHTIRYCSDPVIAYLLVKVRCKKWKSTVNNDTFSLFNWLHKLVSTELRAILIHKFRVSPKTTAKQKLVAMIMDYEFPEMESAYWKIYLPANFENERPPDARNEAERVLILQNIMTYGPITFEQQSMTSSELIGTLIQLVEENREQDRSRFRQNITYTTGVIKATEEPFECSVCYDEIQSEKMVRLNCNHEFCGDCISTHIKKTKSENVMCPMCRTDINTVIALTA